MPSALILRIVLCLSIAAPAIGMRIAGAHTFPVLDMLIFGAAVVAAAFLLAWAAEAAQKDISGALAIAILALIAVLPEYAVDLYYAFRSGSDPAYLPFAAANMTGSNRLLLGFGWPLVVIVGLIVASKAARRVGGRAPRFLQLPSESRLDIGFLALLAIVAFTIPVLGSIPIWFGGLLIAVFIAYLWRAGQVESDGEEEFVGAAALIVSQSTRARRVTVISLFVVSAAIILACAEPFAEALVASGTSLGIDSYFLVQWLAPLASEAPEFIIAVMFALRGMGAAAIGTLIASKVNQGACSSALSPSRISPVAANSPSPSTPARWRSSCSPPPRRCSVPRSSWRSASTCGRQSRSRPCSRCSSSSPTQAAATC